MTNNAHFLTAVNSPFTEEQVDSVNHLISSLTTKQLLWLNGYLAGIGNSKFSINESTAHQVAPVPQSEKLTILYGTETGNSASLADLTEQMAGQHGIQSTIINIADYQKSKLKKEKNLVLITSTHGDGDPPEATRDFYDYLHSDKAPELGFLNYSVLALGDSGYDYFCRTGKDYDRRLEELGAKRITPRIDCDVDYEENAKKWINNLIDALKSQSGLTDKPAGDIRIKSDPGKTGAVKGFRYTRNNPGLAAISDNILLNGRGSLKETRHIELLVDDPDFNYEPGDALGVMPRNSDRVVAELISSLNMDPDCKVTVDNRDFSLQEALRDHFEITVISRFFLGGYARLTRNNGLIEMLRDENKEKLKNYTKPRHIIDVVEDHPPAGISPGDFITVLRKLTPRLYSIASSYRANPGEIHLTVAAVRYTSLGRYREGVASSYISDMWKEGEQVQVYIQKNESFRLPDDPLAPVIMIGPGTGVAPFRAFIQERDYRSAKGKNWLFFGDRNFRTDFLYQLEWQKYHRSGILNKMDVAFSRDQGEKVYVQHRIWDNRKEVFRWMEEGAHVYVCGDANRMAPDVHKTLLGIIAREGGLSKENAGSYLHKMNGEKRYVKDVY